MLLGRLGAEVSGLQPLTLDNEDHGFERHSRPAVSEWQEADGGVGGGFLYACVPTDTSASGQARWLARVNPGTYELQVFVPGSHANARQVSVSLYEVGSDNGVGGSLNQKPYRDEWAPVGVFQAHTVHIELSAAPAAAGNCAYQVAADAIRLVPRTAQPAR